MFLSPAGWLDWTGDLLIALSFYFLLAGLIYFSRRRRDLAYRPIFFILGLILFLAGTLPLSHLWTYWQGPPEIERVIKLITAILSVSVAVLFWRLTRQALTLPSPINLLPPIMGAIRETKDFNSALQTAIQKVCEATVWNYGEAWVPGEEGKVLSCGSVWCNTPAFEKFREISQELRFAPEMGLPGRVWSNQRPEWIRNVSRQASSVFFRVQMAKKAGIKTALGVPVVAENEVAAVLVFFTQENRPEDKRLVNLMVTVAAELGTVIERNRAQGVLGEAKEEAERRVQGRMEELVKSTEALQKEIADLKLIQETLQRSKESYEALMNSIEGIVWEFDLETSKFTLVSQQAEPMLGYPVETWLAEPNFWQDHIHGGDREAVLSFRSRVVRERTDDQIEYRMITADGHARWFRDMVTVVLGNGEVAKLRGTMVDITDQKLIEEALNQERNFASAVLDTASALVLVLDPEGRIVDLNHACAQMSGCSTEDLKGRFFWDVFFSSEDAEEIKTIFSRLLAGQFPANYESDRISKDGTRQAIAWSSTVLFNKENVPTNVIATGIDITKRKEAEQKLEEAVAGLERSNQELARYSRELAAANERLKKLDELKSQFISAASHELKTPLTSVEGYVETVLHEEAGPLSQQQKEFLGYVKQSTDRLRRLLNELLDISKIESGQVRMKEELTDLRDLLKEETVIFKPQAEEKELSLDLEIGADFRKIYCDADKIREVLDNLISNAIKYTPRGGRIKISGTNHEKGIEIDVHDTGIGIKEEDQARIFEPFQHIEKEETEEEESTGLGLTLVKRIVEAHKGEIKVKSQEGKGSTFAVILPGRNP